MAQTAVLNAIGTLYTGSDLETAATGGMFLVEAPEDPEYPYVVYDLVSLTQQDEFGDKVYTALVQFMLASDDADSSTIKDLHDKLISLYDECTLTITGHSFLRMHRTASSNLDRDEGIWFWNIDFEVMFQ